MKIGLVCPYNMFRGGGVQEHVLAQADELRRRGHTVKIITPKPRKHYELPNGNMIFVGNSAKMKTPISTSLELGITIDRDALDEMLAEEDFDVLHIHEPEVPVLGAQIIAKAKCPIVATFHAIHPETPMARTIEVFRIPYSRSIFSRLAEFTAVSIVAAEFVSQRTRRTVHIVPNGIDLKRFKPNKTVKRSENTVLYIGRLEKRKGVKYLLQAFERLSTTIQDAQLLIAGDGPDRERLEEQAVTLGIDDRVRFLGYVSDTEKLKLLSECTLFCSPALYGESFGIVLLEAMAMGAPIVAGDNPGYENLLRERGKLSLVNAKDTADFARRLELFMSDSGLRDLWVNWAIKYVKKFDYTHVVDSYEKLYDNLYASVI